MQEFHAMPAVFTEDDRVKLIEEEITEMANDALPRGLEPLLPP